MPRSTGGVLTISAIARFIKCAAQLKEFTGYSPKPSVVLLGSFNSGKSTLLNYLLGEKVSPVGAVPTTAVLLYFDYGPCFKARYSGPQGKKVFQEPIDLHSFLASVKQPGGRAEIELPSPLLKKCRLVDTPGIDYLDGGPACLAGQVAKEADKIIYLFHQRGIEDFSRLFLYRLAAAWKNRDLNDISFWLNCNLGTCDGTSLETTRAALREIFLSQVRLNAINTFKQENVEALRKFLEVELARENLRHDSGGIKKADRELPQRLKKVTGIKDDSLFLSEFWIIREACARILEAGQLIYSLPSVTKEVECLLTVMNSANLGAKCMNPGGMPYRPKDAGLRENQKALLSLIHELLSEKQVESFVDRAKLKEFYRRIDGERFTIVATGGFSTGKSTFFNALLKENILPASDGPTTACVTRITWGDRKTATVYEPLQVTLQIYGQAGGKAFLCREEIAMLDKWLAAADSGIADLEVYAGVRFEHACRQEVAAQIGRAKDFFAAGSFARNTRSPAPAAFRLVSPKRLVAGKVPKMVRVTFKNPATREFDLSDPAGARAFRCAVGPDNAFRVESVEIKHPAGFLRLADLVDTPGLDWVQRRYHENISRLIMHSDACLVFINARHVLNDMDRENFQELLLPGSDGVKEKFFFAVNFADTLTLDQQGTVYNFVRKNLTFPSRIFLISALKRLAGEDGGTGALLKSLEESILKSRGRDFYLAKVDEFIFALGSSLEKINSVLLSGQSSPLSKKTLRAAQEILREYRKKLKGIRIAIYCPGGFEISGKR